MAGSDYFAEIAAALAPELGLDEEHVLGLLERPPKPELGDVGLPCFALAKELKKPPNEIAADLAQRISPPAIVERVASVGPYVNFFLNRAELARRTLHAVAEEGERYGGSDEGAGKTVVIDYSHPNIAKPFHIGHLRSTIIGNALYKIFRFLGHPCVGVNHIGDWGTQFGKVIAAYRRWGAGLDINKATVGQLVELYVRFHKEAENDPALEDEAREWHRRIEEGDEEARALWRAIVDTSIADFKRTYARLGIEFDSWAGESFYEDKLDDAIRAAERAGITRVDEGALIVDLSADGMPPFILRRSDGASLYSTRDLAAALYRWEKYRFYRMLYVVGQPQELHFKQLFRTLELMGMDWVERCVHVSFGYIRLPEGTMGSRKGNVILLDEVLDQAIERTRAIIEERNPELENKDEVAEEVGIGAVVFFDLSRRRTKDSVFSWEQVLNFDGETGPYVQYCHARLCSVLRKYGRAVDEEAEAGALATDEEWAVVRLLADFPRTVRQAAEEYEPSLVAGYLVQLATAANAFYQKHRIIDAGTEELTRARIRLVDATRQVLANGLGLLGIAAPQSM